MPDDDFKGSSMTSITIEEANDASSNALPQHYEPDALGKSSEDLIDGEAELSPRQQLVRDDLVATAAKFLQTTKVGDSDDFTKQLFLRKKGLTLLEIKEAFARAGLVFEDVNIEKAVAPPSTIPSWQLPPPTHHYPGMGAMQVAHPPPWTVATSLWQRVKEFCHLVLFVTGAAYGAHYLYQHVIRPWLTGRRPPDSVELQVARLQAAVADSLVQLKGSVAALQQAVQGYTAAAKNCPSCGSESSSSLGQQLQQVRNEVTSLKSLMLNRRNFSPTPALAPCIPAWQRTNGNKPSGVTITSDSSTTVTSGSNGVSLNDSNVTSVADSLSECVATSESCTTSAASASKDTITSASLSSVSTKDSNSNKAAVTDTSSSSSTNINSIVYSADKTTANPTLDGRSSVGSNASSTIISSPSVLSSNVVGVSKPDRPARTSSSSGGSMMAFSDALDSCVMNGAGDSDEDLTNSRYS